MSGPFSFLLPLIYDKLKNLSNEIYNAPFPLTVSDETTRRSFPVQIIIEDMEPHTANELRDSARRYNLEVWPEVNHRTSGFVGMAIQGSFESIERFALCLRIPSLHKIRNDWLASLKNLESPPPPISLGNTTLGFDAGRTFVMGILNVTIDSFSDGGRYISTSKAVERGLEMVEEGADILDIGGESTRPGAEPVGCEEELKRVIPVIESLAGRIPIPISIDTYKAGVAESALECGASMVNDISALRMDDRMGEVVAEKNVPVVLMHMKGEPRTMQVNPTYISPIREIISFLQDAIKRALSYGIPRDMVIIDPGIGFGKRLKDNLLIQHNLRAFKTIGRPLLIGTSKKSFIGQVLDLPVNERMEGTLGSVASAVLNGADMVRVHDVKSVCRLIKVVEAIRDVQWCK